MTQLLVWQLVDSAFPSGGFAHSGGLEAAVQHGHVADDAGLAAFARQALAQAGRSALPVVAAAHAEPGTLPALDELSDLFLSNPIANRASRAQGRALLTGAVRSFPRPEVAAVDDLVREMGLAAHVAPLFGALFAALGIDLQETRRAFLFTGLRGVTSAAVRLGLVGTYDAQEMQAALGGEVDAVIARCAGYAPGDIAQTAPLIDLFQSTHDRLYTRLFQS